MLYVKNVKTHYSTDYFWKVLNIFKVCDYLCFLMSYSGDFEYAKKIKHCN